LSQEAITILFIVVSLL